MLIKIYFKHALKPCQHIIVSLKAVSISNIEIGEVGDPTIRLTNEMVNSKGRRKERKGKEWSSVLGFFLKL